MGEAVVERGSAWVKDAATFTIFVDNFPEHVHSQVLVRAFQQCGHVSEVYVPMKRRWKTKSRFGFVKFLSQEAVNKATSRFNGVWWMENKIYVRKANFNYQRHGGASGLRGQQKGNWNPPSLDNPGMMRSVQEHERGDVNSMHLSQTHIPVKRVVAPLVENEWLKLCLVGVVKSLGKTVESLAKDMMEERIQVPIIKPLGGSKVLLQFRSVEEKLRFLQEYRECLDKFFEVVHEWSIHEANLSRKVMLAVYGVPLHACSEETFLLIGDLWGSVVSVDSKTVSKDVLEFGRILVFTNHRGSINHQCELKVSNFIYHIQCFEEPLFDEANPIYCPPKSSSSSFGKVKEVFEEKANYSHVGESILFPKVPSQVAISQIEKSTYKEALQGALQPSTEVGPFLVHRGEEHIESQPVECPEDPIEIASDRELSVHHFRKSGAAEQKMSARLAKAKNKLKLKSIKGKKIPKSNLRKTNFKDPVVVEIKSPVPDKLQISQTSISSSDIRNRNTILKNQSDAEAISRIVSIEDESSRLKKEAEKAMEIGQMVDINFSDMEEDTLQRFMDMHKNRNLTL